MAVEYSIEKENTQIFIDVFLSHQRTVNKGNTIRSNSSTKTLYCPTRGNDDDVQLVYSLGRQERSFYIDDRRFLLGAC